MSTGAKSLSEHIHAAANEARHDYDAIEAEQDKEVDTFNFAVTIDDVEDDTAETAEEDIEKDLGEDVKPSQGLDRAGKNSVVFDVVKRAGEDIIVPSTRGDYCRYSP